MKIIYDIEDKVHIGIFNDKVQLNFSDITDFDYTVNFTKEEAQEFVLAFYDCLKRLTGEGGLKHFSGDQFDLSNNN